MKLIPAQYVKAFVRGNKNDYNDALAIAEAVVLSAGVDRLDELDRHIVLYTAEVEH